MTIREYFQNQRKLRDTSVRCYMICLKKLNKNVEPETLDFLKNFDDVFHFIKQYKPATQRSYMIAVNQALKSVNDWDELKDIYEAKLDVLEYEHQEKIDTYDKSEKEAENWTTLEELKLVADYWLDTIDEIQYSTRHFMKVHDVYKCAIIALLYVDHPAIRLDYATMEIIHSEAEIKPNKNYLLIEAGEKHFILQHYKTSSKHHEKVWSPSTRLSTIIDEWLKINKSGYFLPNRNMDKPMTTNALGKMITRVFESLGKKITVNVIRHIWISQNVDKNILEQNAALASAMCHTAGTQKSYIRC